MGQHEDISIFKQDKINKYCILVYRPDIYMGYYETFQHVKTTRHNT